MQRKEETMSVVKTFYDRSEGAAERELNEYLQEHPGYKITLIATTQVATRQATRLCITAVFEEEK